MSYVARTAQQQTPFETTATKKKFGKNLNKLTKPPPPTANAESKSNASSRNGLLLLSTKRQPSAASAGGILASKSTNPTGVKSLPSLGLQNQSSTSTHDALLGAVVGASRTETHQPDAWGTAEKQKCPSMENSSAANEPFHSHEIAETTHHNESHPGSEEQVFSEKLSAPPYQVNELHSSNWDEYGGRELHSNGTLASGYPQEQQSSPLPDDQKVSMSRMAKERAEKRREEEEARQASQRQGAAQRLRELEDRLGHDGGSKGPPGVKPRTLYDPNRPAKSQVTTSEAPEVGSPFKNGRQINGSTSPDPAATVDSRETLGRLPIQLVSYDDRDRGERGGAATPRMLYDPKSGAMVAVPTREELGAGRSRKERGKKLRNPREKELKNDTKNDESGKASRKGKREKKAPTELATPTKAETKKGKPCNERKLPRTCGVLYLRDSKGNFTCADGCDGDLGYGAHSVPGGRSKNPEAYTKFLEEQTGRGQDDGEVIESSGLSTSYEADPIQHDDSEETGLQSGLVIPEPAEVKFEWLKASDKIELITGIDDSPTLQATAKEWAPSQAALAAAAARLDSGSVDEDVGVSMHNEPQDDDEDEDDDDGPVSNLWDEVFDMIIMSFLLTTTPISLAWALIQQQSSQTDWTRLTLLRSP